MGIKTFAGHLSPGILDEAEEVFFSGTSTKLLPVSQVETRIFSEAPGSDNKEALCTDRGNHRRT